VCVKSTQYASIILNLFRAAIPSSLFLSHNTALVPPYRVLIDTNFINFSLQNKLELVGGMMDCLYAKCECFGDHIWLSQPSPGIPCVTDCVMAELEKLGQRYRLALRCVHAYYLSPSALTLPSVARDPRFERLACSHKGTYADDCLVQRVAANRCFIVATCDRELRRRIRKIPGVPLMYIVRRRYAIEKLPDQGASA
jgi:U3 small nucleolar RNA-associated protein 24